LKVIDETRDDLAALIRKDLGPQTLLEDFDRVLLDWFHYLARSVPRRPRAIKFSSKIELQKSKYPSIEKIAHELKFAGDVRPWLSNSIRANKSNHKADMLFNDWQIHHLHVGDFYESPVATKRSPQLLFVYITAQTAAFLDILPHGSWTSEKILDSLFDVIPEVMDSFELRGIIPSREGWSARDRYELRRANLNAPIQISDRVFMAPGGGIATSGHAVRLVKCRDDCLDMIDQTIFEIQNNKLPAHLSNSLARDLGTPVKLGVRLSAGQMITYDKSRGIDFMLLRPVE
jgi:hypothetical protein